MLSYITPNTFAEFVCFLIAIICLKKDSNIIWKSMILFLLITCITEVAGIYAAKTYHNNHWVYNLFLPIEASFTLLMFGNLYRKYKKSNSVLAGAALFICIYLYDLISHGLYKYNFLTFTTMSVVFVLYSLYYYYLILSDDQYLNLKYSPEFWWTMGVLFFYFGSTVCNIFNERLYSVMITSNHHLSYFVFKALNIILYSCWSYSFFTKWQTRISEIS
ncbi:hypothetical protein BEL04_19290 [Mucilaginibacter sp. PPCGB 2223]|nr:hypothetical protein BEL04_19290 [Mucilaginibacter sp. PPCGB 2223]